MFILHVDERSTLVSGSNGHSGRRVHKSRDAIATTFNELLFNGRYAETGVSELVVKAGVGRSTFYEHFDDKVALLVESIYPLLSVIAEAASGMEAPHLLRVLAHFEEQRAHALRIFQSTRERSAIEASLAKLIAEHLPRNGSTLPLGDIAKALSRLSIGLIGDWLAADRRIQCTELAYVFLRTASTCRSTLLTS